MITIYVIFIGIPDQGFNLHLVGNRWLLEWYDDINGTHYNDSNHKAQGTAFTVNGMNIAMEKVKILTSTQIKPFRSR